MGTAQIRPWKYDNTIREYFVETETKQTIKESEMIKRTETADLGESFLHWPCCLTQPCSLCQTFNTRFTNATMVIVTGASCGWTT